jgi:outer membrane protein assembly factor BamB
LFDAIGLITIVALLAGATALYAHAWRTSNTTAGTVERYAPSRDGLSTLSEVRDETGKLIRHEGTNARRVAPANVFLILPTDIRGSVTLAVSESADAARSGKLDANALGNVGLSELDQARVLNTRTLGITPDAKTTQTDLVTVAGNGGLFQAGLILGDGGTLALTPPLLLLPADLGPNAAPWHSEGLVGSGTYTYDAHVTGAGPQTTAVGVFDDCLTVVDTLSFGVAPQETVAKTTATYCAGIGAIERNDDTTQADGTVVHERLQVVATNARDTPAAGAPTPASGPTGADVALGDPGTWAASRFARSAPTGISAGANSAPLHIPTDPPQVLEADELGDVVSFDAATGAERWRFHLGAPAFGLIGYDAPSHTVLVGSSDHRVYAVDDSGLFRWAFATKDNVASRPVVADGVVVFGSEDGNVYGVDLATGARKWSTTTSAAVASSPAFAQGVVAIGDDDGNLLALDPQTGRQVWSASLPGASEGPVGTDGSVFYAGSGAANTLGAVSAFDVKTGNAKWVGNALNPVRTEVIAGDTLVFAIDNSGILFAFDKQTGEERWSTRSVYVGPPAAQGDRAVALRPGGEVDAFDASGAVIKRLSTVDAHSPVDPVPDHAYGLSAGGGAVWAADSSAVLYRIGPNDVTPRLRVAWADGPAVGSPGIPTGQLNIAPAVRGTDLVLTDPFGQLSIVDTKTGAARSAGKVDVGDQFIRAQPAVVGDLFVTAVGSNLVATNLTTGTTAWRVTGDGLAVAPVLVEDGLVIWTEVSSTTDPATGLNPGTLRAIDPATGKDVWQVTTQGSAAVNPTVVGDTLVTSTPPTAFDIRTGAVRWTANTPGTAFGSGTVDPATNTVVVPLLTGANTVTLVGLDASTGAARWQQDLAAGEGPSLNSRMLVDHGVVVFPTSNSRVLGVDAATGASRWTYTPPGPMFGSIEVASGAVYLVAGRGTIVAVDVLTGAERGRSSDLDIAVVAQGLTFVHPVAVNGVVVFPMVTFVLAVEPPS